MGGFDHSSEAAEAEAEQSNNNRPRLPLFNPPPTMHSPSPEMPSGMLTPPLHTSASVPFQWEEEPGMPRPCTALVALSNPTTPKCLALPPRLLEGPTHVSTNCCRSPYGSFGAERVLLGDTVLNKGVGMKEKGCFGSWRGKRAVKVRREVSRGSYVFPSSAADRDDTTDDDDDDHVGITGGGSHKKLRVTKMKASGSFYNLFQSKLWTKICEGLKQVAPRRKH